MVKFVLKRDGTKSLFDQTRIGLAIQKAAGSANQSIDNLEDIINKVLLKLPDNKDTVSVYDIESYVETVLMCSKYKNTAKKYIEYRKSRDIARESKSKLLKNILGFKERTSDEYTNENANKDSVIVNSHRDLYAGIMSKYYAVTQFLSKNVADVHESGFIHVHDLDYIISPLTNCCNINYPDMMRNGFKIGAADIEMPKSISTATTVVSQIVQAVASAQYGGSTLPHIDLYLSEYVEKSHKKLIDEADKWGLPEKWVLEKLDKEVYDAMQTLLYQLNTLVTCNGQTPFITISFGTDTSFYGRLIQKNYLMVHKNGIGKKHITPTFPKVVYFLEDGVNMKPSDPCYDIKKLAIDCAVDRIYPDFISVPLNKKLTGCKTTVTTPMGCRSFLSKFINESGDEQVCGRFNLGVVSVNLPMIAQEAKVNHIDFYENLKKYLEICFDAHMERVDMLKKTKARQNPIMWMYGAISRLDPDEYIEKLFYNGYASISIGYIGVSELCEILSGKQDKELAIKVLQYIKDVCDEFTDRTNISFSLYGTPSEGYCYKAATSFKKLFGDDIIERDYLTNSFHQPVWIDSDPYSKWLYEEGFAFVSKGGNISYVEQPSLKNNKEAYENLIDFAYKHIPYFGINTPIDHCFKCGFGGEFKCTSKGFQCPKCGNREEGTMSVIRRVSGYLSAPDARPFNKGKHQEMMERKKHEKSVDI